MKKVTLGALILSGVILSGCGDPVRIYPNEVGYEVSGNGVSEREWGPGAHRLSWCGTNACPAIIRIDRSKNAQTVEVNRVYLPLSNVDLENVSFSLQYRVKNTPEDRRTVISEVESNPAKDAMSPARERVVPSTSVYGVYIERIVAETVIEVLKEYSVEQTLTEIVTIGQHAKREVNKRLLDTPVEVVELSFSNGIGQVPEQVINAKRELYAVEEEKAREIKALNAETALEDKRQAFQKVRVENNRANAEAAGVDYATYVSLMVNERMADAAEAVAAAASTNARNSVPFAVGTVSPSSITQPAESQEGAQ